ncbi:hypothetical protein [Bifidobacterium pseudolongum]|uniref:XRE family transcriptional regulator n=1 Tax=Bifidobacterium pseudolongum subsp. globosum TaxID=1690 RepID=A0AB37X616_9BIFI|nr:hypothetical protein [Bifidobacterium pseudolongum]RYQ39774.1 hypothetical protein PG2002B_0093 [Bifidobacterium pseudolongum subsp. globosum]
MRMNEIVGDWLQGYRAEHGLTLDQIADASHRYGTNWGNVNVSRMEKGGGKVDALPTLMVLLATLNDLVGKELKLADVFTDYAGTVDLGGYTTSYENVAHILQGSEVAFNTSSEDMKRFFYDMARDWDGIQHPERGVWIDKFIIGDDTTPYIDPTRNPTIAIKHYPTAAEKRLENRLLADTANDDDINKLDDWIASEDLEEWGGMVVAAICDVLYGHSLDEEAAKRAGEGATPQKRGRVTRVLAGEILDYMRKVAAKLED